MTGRLASAYRATAIIMFSTAVLILLVECAAFATVRWTSICRPAERPVNLRPMDLSYYKAQPWGRDFWREHAAAESVDRYAPYLIWKTAPYQGRYINISADRVRYTPGVDCSPNAYRVFVFGGSAVWGWGTPDSGTLPAHLQTELMHRRSGPVCVVNLGQNAYVSTQEVFELIARLQRGDVPALAVFYDGLNDAYAAFETRAPGVHFMVDRIAAKMERSDNDWRHAIGSLVRSTSSYRLAQCVPGRQPAPVSARVAAPAVIDDKTRQLGSKVLDIYLENYRIVDSLAHTYGFQFGFFWQPSQFAGHKPLTDEEQAMRPQDARSLPLMAAIYQGAEAAAGTHPNLHYLGNVFDNETAATFIDYLHVTPDGNAKIAKAIADVVSVAR
jgi:hypothetical protein